VGTGSGRKGDKIVFALGSNVFQSRRGGAGLSATYTPMPMDILCLSKLHFIQSGGLSTIL
jgi:hypothetical protein